MSKTYKEKLAEFTDDMAQTYKVEPSFNVTSDGHIEAYDKVMDSIESIQTERENDYGDALVSHQSIANFWNEYLTRKGDFEVEIMLDATDVAVMLSLMKVSRLAYKRKHDSFLDFASYADFALQFEENIDERN